MFKDQSVWLELQDYLPLESRITDKVKPVEEVVEYQNSEIRFDKYNGDSDISVVIFHGVGGNGRLLSFLAVPLAKQGYNVICPDLPGYGYSKMSSSFDYSSWVDVGAFMAKRELEKGKKVFLMGLSAGGMLSYNVACKVKDIEGIFITNLLDNQFQEVRDYSAKNKFHSRVGLKILNSMPKFITNMKIPVKSVANMGAIVNDKNILKILLRDKVGSGSSVEISFLLSMMKAIPVIKAEEFDLCPVLMAHPDNDKWTPTFVSRLFFDKIKGDKELVLLENCGHFPIEEPGYSKLIKTMLNFLKNRG